MSRRKTEVGIREIARESGVSPATVSRVLRGLLHVSEAVRLQVLTAAGRLHYHPEPPEERGAVAVILPALAGTAVLGNYHDQLLPPLLSEIHGRGFQSFLVPLGDLGLLRRCFPVGAVACAAYNDIARNWDNRFAIPLVGFPLQAYLKKKTKLLVRTYTDKVIAEVWGIIGLFTAVAVLVYGGDAHMTKFIMPIIVLGSGIGVAISGSIISDKWMRYSGMISFFLGVFAFRDSTGVTVYEGFYNDYITFIICIVLMFIIPGHRLTREARRLQKKEVE